MIYFVGFFLDEIPIKSQFAVILRGAFAEDSSTTQNFLYIQFQQPIAQPNEWKFNASIPTVPYSSDFAKIPIISNISAIDMAKEVQKTHTFYLDSNFFQNVRENSLSLEVQITTNLPIGFSISLAYDPSPIDKSLGVLYATVILIGLYVVIIWEIVDRTFAASLKFRFNPY